MKIEVKQNKNVVLFGDIEAGEVFQCNDYYYIKVTDYANHNAIDLHDGTHSTFSNDDEILFIPSAKLVIE